MDSARESPPLGFIDDTVSNSPFDDRFEFEPLNQQSEQENKNTKKSEMEFEKNSNMEQYKENRDNTKSHLQFSGFSKPLAFHEAPLKRNGSRDDDNLSFTHTPKADGTSSVRFENNVYDGHNDEIQHKASEMKRLRWGTRRNHKGHTNFGRAKTLRWAKKNFQNPFVDDVNKTDQYDEVEPNDKNRSSETRFIYYGMDLPLEMLDEENKPKTIYPRNKIRTTKYTPLTFFPKNIAFQFKNIANIYFLIMVILGCFQIFGVTSPALAAAPLIVIVIITAIKDAIEDSRRTILDLEVNNTPTHILFGMNNNNVYEDNISLWRKFKKASTKKLFSFIRFCNEAFTKDGKRRRSQRQRAALHTTKTKSSHVTFDSMSSYRMSIDCDNIGQIVTEDSDVTILDKSIPPAPNSKFIKSLWKDVKVGDVVRIHNNDEIPADVILLSTSDSDGACYVETKNLDGETNLKVRQSLKSSYAIRNSRDITRTKFWIESEGPNANLYSYQGNLKWIDPRTNDMNNEPININNMLLRGCFLRNTKWAMGLVVFTGEDTKIMLNAGITPTKKSRIARELNYSVSWNFGFLFILCFIAGLINGIYYQFNDTSRSFFEIGAVNDSPVVNGIISFWVSVILYQSLVPISLYISIEIIKTAQAAFIYGDVLLYNERLDYPCTPKTWNISDDLGQIEYIFSDKTGTLTQNVMEFKKCTINGVSYGHAYTEALAGLRKRQGIDVEQEGARERAEIAEEKKIMIEELKNLGANSQLYPSDVTFISNQFVQDLKGASGVEQKNCNEYFMLALALCHSVLIEPYKDDPNKLQLKAQSPDEAALVGTARDMGFNFVGRTKKGLIIEIQGAKTEFQILNILEFNSSRKRMTCIVKLPGKSPDSKPKALLICKGADSVIYSRLDRSHQANDEKLLEKTALHLEQFATEGLRTLCIAQRELTWEQYEEWNAKYEIATASLTDREDEIEMVADSIERELILLGGTAIEDRLQDGVPDSISLLADAGIKLWVLTGDKIETAINIGFSCNLLSNDMNLLVIKSSGEDVESEGLTPYDIVNNLIQRYLLKTFGLTGSLEELEEAKKDHRPPISLHAVVIDGDALKLALYDDDISRKFLLLCKYCKAVLCCRVSPSQKAAVVNLVKTSLDVITLAIGDGSNDVAMIQSADVGVGIAGEEGRQAVMSSDYAIGQFRYLARLLLVHGRWSYKRLAKMISSFFYKNVVFTLALFWYGIYNNFDGSYLFDYTYLTLYNLAFTALPVIFMGIFDQDVNDSISVVVPQLYRVGILRTEWTQLKFWYHMIDGLYQSIISFFFPYLLFYKSGLVSSNGLGLDHRYWVGIMVASIAVTSCNLYVLLHQYRWDWFSTLFVLLSSIVIFGWTGIWSSFIKSGGFYKSGAHVYAQPSFWAVFFAGVIFCLLPRFTFDIFQKFFWPKDIDVVRECWASGAFDCYPEGYDPTDPKRPKIDKINFGHNNSLKDVEVGLQNEILNSSVSNETDYMEEIPLNIIGSNESSPNIRHTSSGTQRYSSANARSSLDITRSEMRKSNQLDTRYSVSHARLSLDLPGLTRAETLMKQ